MKKKFIIGKKIGMTQLLREDGVAEPVTVVEAGPCPIIKINTQEKDGRNSVLIAYQELKPKKITKPIEGQYKASKVKPHKFLKEFRCDELSSKGIGDIITVANFEANEKIDVRGKSKGKGFTGTIKRWNFSRGPMTHGSKSHRIPGSIGAGTTPGRVLKGKKMAGQHGDAYNTIKNLKIVKIDVSKNLLFIKGAIPGADKGIVEISA